jgi:NCAIR mutase (PurE)-related protein
MSRRECGMDNKAIVQILEAVRSGKLSVDEAVARLSMCYESLGFANLDIGRGLRTGIHEVPSARARPATRWFP